MIFTCSAIGTALAPRIPWLITGVVVSGLAIGIASFISPMYITELVPSQARGALVAVNMLAITAGIVIAYLVDYAFFHPGMALYVRPCSHTGGRPCHWHVAITRQPAPVDR
jgi:SP family galactose:H+ symporter-like MFS transporter